MWFSPLILLLEIASELLKLTANVHFLSVATFYSGKTLRLSGSI